MDPLLLTFVSAPLEVSYTHYAALVTNLKVDACFWWFTLIARVAGYLRFGEAVPWSILFWLAGDAAARRLAGSGLWRWREGLAVFSRMFRMIEFCTAFDDIITDRLESAQQADLLSAAFSAAMCHGLMHMVFLGLFQPLRFRLHLPLHLLSSAALFASLNLEICRRTDGAGVAGIEKLFDFLAGLARRVVGAAFTPNMDVGSSWKAELPCLQQAMFIQVFLGCVVISYVVWLFERHSRVAFIESLPRKERPKAAVKDLQWSTVFVHATVLLAAFGFLWRMFIDVAPGLFEWGVCRGLPAKPDLCSTLRADFEL